MAVLVPQLLKSRAPKPSGPEMTDEEANALAVFVRDHVSSGKMDRAAHRDVGAAKVALATAFGRRFGWRWKSGRSGFQALYGKRPHFNEHELPPHSDHQSSYKIGRETVALIEQPYLNEKMLGEMRRWADTKNLVMSVPDWPSWHYPDETTLCLFMRRESLPRALLPTVITRVDD